jgi:hypothetical protein
MPISNTINSAGLIFDILGAGILWRFGLPPSINRDGHITITCQQTNEQEKDKAGLYDFLSHLGLFLVALGFVFQLISNFITAP